MTQAKTSTKASASKANAASEIELYIDTLIANQNLVNDALQEARERGVRLSGAVAQNVANKQVSALELAKKLAADPKDYKGNMETVLESLTKSQSEAFDFFKAVVAGQGNVAGEYNAIAKSLFEGTRDTSQAALNLARTWGVDSPISGMVKQSMATAKQAAEKFTKAVV